tara:strand:+ start:768 stop:1940 length:1173 start_codon:yes stop_codon:yes gene_type:complete
MLQTRRITTMGGDKFKDDFSVDFDGTNDYIEANFRPDYIHTNATMGMWVKMGDFTSEQMLGSHGGKRWYMGFNGTKATIGVADANNVSSGITISPTPKSGEWLHYVLTAVDGTATVYINGIAQGTLSYTQSSTTNPSEDSDNNFLIGARQNSDANAVSTQMNCKISELFQYDKGLTASEVKTLYNGREPYNHKEGICSSNLKAWWRMGDGTFDTKNTTDSDAGIICDEVNVGLGSDVLGGKGDMSDESYWTKTGSASDKVVFADGVCKFLASDNGTDNMTIKKTGILTVGKVYRLDLDITATEHTSTTILINESNPYVNINNVGEGVGSYTVYWRATQTYLDLYRWYIDGTQDTSKYIHFDNVVVREVIGDNHGIMKSMEENDIEGDGAN